MAHTDNSCGKTLTHSRKHCAASLAAKTFCTPSQTHSHSHSHPWRNMLTETDAARIEYMHTQEQCIEKRGVKHFHPPSYLSQRNTCRWFSILTSFLSLSDGSDDGCNCLESLHPLPPPPRIHRWPLPLPLSLSIVNSTPFTELPMIPLCSPLHYSPSFVSAAPGLCTRWRKTLR